MSLTEYGLPPHVRCEGVDIQYDGRQGSLFIKIKVEGFWVELINEEINGHKLIRTFTPEEIRSMRVIQVMEK